MQQPTFVFVIVFLVGLACSQTLTTITLSSPINGASEVGCVTFKWRSVNGASTYYLIYGQSKELANPIIVNVTSNYGNSVSKAVDLTSTGIWYWKVTTSYRAQGKNYYGNSTIANFTVCTTVCTKTIANDAVLNENWDGTSVVQWTFTPGTFGGSPVCPSLYHYSATTTIFPYSGTSFLYFNSNGTANCTQSASYTSNGGVNLAKLTANEYLFVFMRVTMNPGAVFTITLGNHTIISLDHTNYLTYHYETAYKLARFAIPSDLIGVSTSQPFILKMVTTKELTTVASEVLLDDIFISDFTRVSETWCKATVPLQSGISDFCESAGLCWNHNQYTCPSCNLADGNEACCVGTCLYCATTDKCNAPSTASCSGECSANGITACKSDSSCLWCQSTETCMAKNGTCTECEDTPNIWNCATDARTGCHWCSYGTSGTCNATTTPCYAIASSEMTPIPVQESSVHNDDPNPTGSNSQNTIIGTSSNPYGSNGDNPTAIASILIPAFAAIALVVITML